MSKLVINRIDLRMAKLEEDFDKKEYMNLLQVIRSHLRRTQMPELEDRMKKLQRMYVAYKDSQACVQQTVSEEQLQLLQTVNELSLNFARGENIVDELDAVVPRIISFLHDGHAGCGENLLVRALDLRARAKNPSRLRWQDIESAFDYRMFGGLIVNVTHEDPSAFFNEAVPVIVERLQEALNRGPVKLHGALQCRFVNPAKETEHIICFRSATFTLYPNDEVSEQIQHNLVDVIMQQLDSFEEGESGLALDEIMHLKVNVNKCVTIPCAGSTFAQMPDWISATRSVLNIENKKDNKCFLWAVLAALHPCRKNAGRVSKYRRYAHELVYEEKDFPMTWRGIKKFEIDNDLRIYVYAWDQEETKDKVLYPRYASRRDTGKIIDLFVMPAEDMSGFHFALIRDIHRFLHSQTGYTRGRGELCRNCLGYVPDRMVKLHQKNCLHNKPCRITMPEKSHLKFTNHRYRERVPVMVYADFECMLVPDGERVHHQPIAAGLYVQCEPCIQLVESGYRSYMGADCARWFVNQVMEIADSMAQEYQRNIPMAELSEEDLFRLEKDPKCWICEQPFSKKETRVADHNHWTGEFRGPAHQECNINYREPKVIPVVLHNLSGYDGHFIVDELTANDYGEIEFLPTTKEQYISFFVRRNPKEKLMVRFIDSYRFMPRSLAALGDILKDKPILNCNLDPDDLSFVRGKLDFPYEWLTDVEKLSQSVLPEQCDYNSKFNDTEMCDEDYAEAMRVWTHFKSKYPDWCMRDHLMLYLKVDVCLLADIFECFRTTCHRIYALDPGHYVTAPSLAFDAALKYTGVSLQLLRDIDMINFIQEGIRGGTAHCSGRFAQANTPGTSNYDETKPPSCLVDIDANNLYGWSMSQSLPYDKFSWLPEELWWMIGKESHDYGYFIEVTLDYPYQESHEDYPLAPEHRVPPPAKHGEKLICSFYRKERYVVYYKTLQLYEQLGIKVVETHRVLRFLQRPWLAPYINLNTKMRQQATNEFERDFFKFMNNSVFGKFIENVRRRRKVKISRTWEGRAGAAARIANPNFRSEQIMKEDRVIIEMQRSKICLDKPIYVGAVILDMAKYLMYSFHYQQVLAHMPEAQLLYTDTDSLIYYLPVPSFADLYYMNPSAFDTSNYPEYHPLYSEENKNVIGKFKDEMKGQPIKRFCGLRAKMYCVQVEETDLRKRAKGLRKPVVKRLTFKDYTDCLRRQHKVKKVTQHHFRSIGHQVFTESITKAGLCGRDDKRFVDPADPTKTYAWSEPIQYWFEQLSAQEEDDSSDASSNGGDSMAAD